MIIKGPLIPGVFIERPNRFITLVEVNGKIVRSHLPDPGRLKEVLIPGTEVLLKPATNLDSRKTKFSTVSYIAFVKDANYDMKTIKYRNLLKKFYTVILMDNKMIKY